MQARPAAAAGNDATTARLFLQERLAYLSALLAVGSGLFWLIRLAAETIEGQSLAVWLEPNAITHFVAIGIFGSLWLYTRAGERSVQALYAADAIALTASCLVYVCMVAFIPRWMHPALLATLINTLALFARSIWVPSTARHTAAIGAAMGVILIGGNSLVQYSNFDPMFYMHGTKMALGTSGTAEPMLTREYIVWGTAADISLWWSLIVFMCASASKVIHGLRREVRDFRELGQYTLEAKLGEGGMGAVYRARHAMLRRPTAIKLMRRERAGELDLARFEREVQLTAQLSHPNIVTVFDYGRTPDGTFYYAMEYLHGASVAEVVKHAGAQPPARVARILRDVAAALAEAHENGLIHRDIKPANIMLCKYGGTMGAAKVVDFGLVRPVERPSAMSGDMLATDAQSFVGTPVYMAPEAFLQPDELDPRSDLYALGAVGYYMLTGTPVFRGKTALELCMKHVNEEPEPPSRRLGKPLPPALEDLVLMCLEKQPDRRPQSAKALQMRLEGIMGELGAWDEEAWWAADGRELLARAHEEAHPPGITESIAGTTATAIGKTVTMTGGDTETAAMATAPTVAIDLRHRS